MSVDQSTDTPSTCKRRRVPTACQTCGIIRNLRTDAISKRCRKCSAVAGGKAPKPTRKTGEWAACAYCGSIFYRRKSAATQKCCSPLCAAKAKKATPEDKKRKVAARAAANLALKAGIIKPQPCTVCGEAKAEMHHADYSKPLSVEWLCFKHHTELHVNAGDLKVR